MTEQDQDHRLEELDRLLNDPETRMDPHKVWSLLAEVSEPKVIASTRCTGR